MRKDFYEAMQKMRSGMRKMRTKKQPILQFILVTVSLASFAFTFSHRFYETFSWHSSNTTRHSKETKTIIPFEFKIKLPLSSRSRDLIIGNPR